MYDETEVMPAGAMPPEPEPEDVPVEEPAPLLGKFKSPDELVSAYSELERKLGEQGNELGTMKQMNTMLMEQMQQAAGKSQVPPSEGEKDTFDYQGQKAALRARLDEGEMSEEDYEAARDALTAEYATRNAVSKYEQLNQQRAMEATQQKWMADNPDFGEMRKAGVLENAKRLYPGLHDDFSAYYAIKAEQAQAAAQAKAEQERIAGGDRRTDKVLTKPGAKAKDIGKPSGRMSQSELRAHTLARLEAME